MLNCAELLEVRLLEPFVPHVAQPAEDERAVVADDTKFETDEIAIVSYPSLTVLSCETKPYYRWYRNDVGIAITVIGIFPIAPVLTVISAATEIASSRLILPLTEKFPTLRITVVPSKRPPQNIQSA